MNVKLSSVALSISAVLVIVLATVVAVVQGGTTDAAGENRSNPSPLSPQSDTVKYIRLLIIGDSFTEGTRYGGKGSANWTDLAQQRLTAEKPADCPILLRVSGRGGAGYDATGIRGTTFGDEIARLMTPDISGVLILGSGNDIRHLSALYPDEVGKVIGKVHAVNPAANILIVGPAWIRDSTPDAGHVEANRLLAEAARQNDSAFVNPIAERWFAGVDGVVGPDRVHPTDKGHEVIADHLTPELAEMARTGRCE
jgi:lysophospholipase L1-like esterase